MKEIRAVALVLVLSSSMALAEKTSRRGDPGLRGLFERKAPAELHADNDAEASHHVDEEDDMELGPGLKMETRRDLRALVRKHAELKKWLADRVECMKERADKPKIDSKKPPN